jgi:hypothetical protein
LVTHEDPALITGAANQAKETAITRSFLAIDDLVLLVASPFHTRMISVAFSLAFTLVPFLSPFQDVILFSSSGQLLIFLLFSKLANARY